MTTSAFVHIYPDDCEHSHVRIQQVASDPYPTTYLSLAGSVLFFQHMTPTESADWLRQVALQVEVANEKDLGSGHGGCEDDRCDRCTEDAAKARMLDASPF